MVNMQRKNYYIDLKEGDKLRMGGLELTLLVIRDKNRAMVKVAHKVFGIEKKEYCNLSKCVGLFNYGNRHHGKLVHVRLELPECLEYKRIRQRVQVGTNIEDDEERYIQNVK